MPSYRPSVEEILDIFEIQTLFNRYTHHHDIVAPRFAAGDIDGSEFEVFDEIFTADAILDYTRSGGIRGGLQTMKAWLPTAFAHFPIQHHLMGQVMLTFSEDRREAEGRTWMINPMGFGRQDGTLHVFVTGGFYLDRLVRTDNGWRIRERKYDQQWTMGDLPAELANVTASASANIAETDETARSRV